MKLIPAAVTAKVARQALVAQKHSPTLLFAGGVAGVIAGTVLAAKATLKVEEVMEDVQAKRQMIEAAEGSPQYSDKDRQQDLMTLKVQAATKLGRLYAPAIIATTAGIVMLTTSHNILSKRNAALTAAYATIDKAFKRYRQKVVDEYGEEVDQRFRFETERVEIKENGRKKVVERVAPHEPSQYAKFFDETNANWNRDPETNLIFLKVNQAYFNNLLQSRGHVFLNEVYQHLGIDHTKAGSVVGWVLGNGDDHIDFGLFSDRQTVRDFINCREQAILLDFNVDGVIYDLIERDGCE